MFARKVLAPLAGISLVLACSSTLAQRGGDPSIPDEVRALMKRHEAKGLAEDHNNSRNTTARRANTGQSGGAGGAGGCNVEIGNVDNSGRIGAGPRQVTTIITGPVIQSNNKCN